MKYLARYLTGGPISDRRLVAYDGRSVTFAAGACIFFRPASQKVVALAAGALGIAINTLNSADRCWRGMPTLRPTKSLMLTSITKRNLPITQANAVRRVVRNWNVSNTSVAQAGETSLAAMRGQHGIERGSRMNDSVSDNSSRCSDRFETETDLFAAAPLRGCCRNRCSNNSHIRIKAQIRRNRTTVKSPIPG